MLTFENVMIFVGIIMPVIIISAVCSAGSFAGAGGSKSFLSDIPNMPNVPGIPGIPGGFTPVTSILSGVFFLLILAGSILITGKLFNISGIPLNSS